mgnify:CR=1 FL=1
MVGWNQTQQYVAAALGHVLFWGLFFVFGFQGWVPVFPLMATALAFLNVIIILAWNYTGGESVPGFETTTKQQLTDEKARTLARYMIVYNYGFRVDRAVAGIDPAVSSSDDKEDAVRLFRYEFEPLNRSGRVTLFIDLEQDLSVDVDDLDSLQSAVMKVQNKGMVKSWMSEDYEQACEEKKKSLGRSVDPRITVERTRDGREIREFPARMENQSTSNTDSEEAES